jgi:hypothetical protein
MDQSVRDRHALNGLAEILSPADLGVLLLLGNVLDLRRLDQAAATELVRETRRRASKRAAEARFEQEAGRPL